ncbi:MAG: helix-turn-helix domain-containing protein [Leptospira sp.]|nr:helix-turn-helix domain-containing protein [Leptospira sp.]
MPELNFLIPLLKFATIAQLFFLILNFLLRVRISLRSVLASLFSYSIICYILCPLLNHVSHNLILVIPVHTGCFSVAILFYLFASSLFSDEFELKAWHGIAFILINLSTYYIIFLSNFRHETSASSEILVNLPQFLSLGFILFTLASIYKDRKIDLLEKRREFRILFVWVTGFYAIIVVLFEVALKKADYSAGLDFFNSFSIFLIVFFMTYSLFDLKNNIFFNRQIELEDEPIDQKLLIRLNSILDHEKIFLEESLTITELSKKLLQPEKKVRKLINKGLGYRNFNEFLNHYRICEASKILSDPLNNETPVLRVAMDMGYGSLAPFNKAFKEINGLTPSEFRRQSSNKNT